MKNHFEIITAYTENISNISDLSYESMAKYGDKHGIPHSRYLLEDLTRAASWYKIPLILSKFDEGAEYVMWIDADTLITNYNFDVRSLLDDSNLYICRDINGINCGVMIWKNCQETRDILDKIWSMTDYDDHMWWEQAALMHLYDTNFNNITASVKFIKQNVINAYDYNLYGMSFEEGQFNNESMLIHFPGIGAQHRVQLMQYYKQNYDLQN